MFESVWSTFQSLLRHLKSDTDPPLLTGYVIHTQNPGFLGDRGYVINSQKSRILERGYLIHTKNPGFLGDRGYVIYSKKSRILERGYLIEGGAIILNWVVVTWHNLGNSL